MSALRNPQVESAIWPIIDRLPISIYVKDCDCRFTYANHLCARALGLEEPEAALGKTDADFFSAEQAIRWIATEKAIMGGQEEMIDRKEIEFWPDGRWRWVLSSKLRLATPEGTVVGLLGMTRDITDSEQIQQAVIGSRVGLWYRSLRTDHVWYSAHWKELLGFREDELSNERRHFRKRVHPHDWPSIMKQCDAHIAGHTPYYECRFRMRHRNGGYKWIYSTGMTIRDEDGVPRAFAGSHTDITDSLQREAFYLKVLDTIPDLIFVKDSQLRFVFVNRALAANFDSSKEDILGKRDRDINTNPDEVAHFQEDDIAVIEHRASVHIPLEKLTDAKGNERILTTRKVPLSFPGGTGRHLLGVATDITELESTREDLRKSLGIMSECLRAIEGSDSESDAYANVLLHLDALGYDSAMFTFIGRSGSVSLLSSNVENATGRFMGLAPRVHHELELDQPSGDLISTVVSHSRAKFIVTEDFMDEKEREFYATAGILGQYVLPISTDSCKVGTLQIAVDSVEKGHSPVYAVVDAIASHLSAAIERHQMLRKLESVNTDLTSQARIIAFEAAASVILHDLNHSISDYAILLREKIALPTIRENREAFDFLKHTLKQISRWTNSVRRNVAQVRRNQDIDEHIIDDLVKETVGMWQHKARAQNRKLIGKYGAGGARVRTRSGTVVDFLSCLIVNSTEANARKIVVSTRTVKATAPSEGAEEYVEISVTDDGDGIPEAFQRNIYEFGWSSKEAGRGHGMGMTVVDVLARSVSGSLELRSAGKSAGQNVTEFVVSIPCVPDDDA